MNNNSDHVVSHYLDSLLLDLTLPEPELNMAVVPVCVPQDSIVSGQRMVPCFDPFLFMDINAGYSSSQHWLVYLCILHLSGSLPAGQLKKYCLRQCQALLNHLHNSFP